MSSKLDYELTGQMYRFAFNYFEEMVVQIRAMQKEMEVFLLDLEDIYLTSGRSQQEAREKVAANMERLRARHRYVDSLDREMWERVQAKREEKMREGWDDLIDVVQQRYCGDYDSVIFGDLGEPGDLRDRNDMDDLDELGDLYHFD